MFCSECGKQVADNAKFCGECGAAQTSAAAENTFQNIIKNSAKSNIASYIIGAIVLVGLSYLVDRHFTANKTTQGNQVESASKIGNASINESPDIANGLIEIILESKKNSVSDYCDLYFELRNKTKLNFTDLGIEYILRDVSGNIIAKKALRERVAPNASAITSSASDNCSSIISIEITGVASHSTIDGEFKGDKFKVTSIPIKSASKLATISIKSSGGILDEVKQTSTNHEIVNELSYCAALAVGQSIWNKQNGNDDVASTLEKGALAYGQTAVEFGISDGLSKSDVITINKSNSSKVTEEMKDKSFFDGNLLNEKNNSCLTMVKNNPTLLSIWQRNFDN